MAPSEPQVPFLPALQRSVLQLLEEVWPQARSDLLDRKPGAASSSSSPPLPDNVRAVKSFAEALEHTKNQRWRDASTAATIVRSMAWEHFLAQKGWKRACEKELFMLTELLLALAAAALGEALKAVSHADGTFIFAPKGPFRSAALLFVQLLDEQAQKQREAGESAGLADCSFPAAQPKHRKELSTAAAKPVTRLRQGCGKEELKGALERRQPAVLEGLFADSPAAARWASLSYLDRAIGHRLVPTEVGAAVGKEEWKEELMSFGSFLRHYVLPSCTDSTALEAPPDKVAYCAQHELLEQCPGLRADIAAAEVFAEVFGAHSRCNVWIGTRSTVTPCHWDSYDNCLAQVQGFKRLLLLAPAQAKHLYVEDGGSGVSAQGNLSAVDVEAPDLTRFPDFVGAEVLCAELGPGDALFIPAGWWHQVRALSASISVNFWY